MHPKVSAVMPFYNREKYLDQTMQSILDQTFTDFELIVVDDASTDNSLKIVEKYAKKDSRIVILRNKKNLDISLSRNRGMQSAKSDLIAVVDSDDINMPERFEEQYNFLTQHQEIDIVGTHAYVIDSEGECTGEEIRYLSDPKKLAQNFFYLGPFLQPTTMLRKKRIMEMGGYREKYTLLDDMDLYFRFFMEGGKGANIPKKLLAYRRHRESTGIHVHERRELMFTLKKEMVSTYHPRLSFSDYLSMYGWYALWKFIPEKQMVQFESLLKKIIYH